MNWIKSNDTNFKGVGQPLRIALTGSKFGPGIYDIITFVGKKEVTKRLTNKKLSLILQEASSDDEVFDLILD